jgi:hypothetical protein
MAYQFVSEDPTPAQKAVGHQDGIDYLVMECVDGDTLAKRLEKGPLPLEPASTFVSTTPRDFCFSPLRDNGDLRRPSFLAVGANCLQDFLIRDFADLFSRLCRRLEKLLLPAPAFAASR